MPAYFHLSRTTQRPITARFEYRNRVRSPRRNINSPVGSNFHCIWIVIGRQSLDHLLFRQIHNSNAVADVLRHVQIISSRRHRQACRIARARSVSLLLTQHDLAHEFRCAIFPGIAEYRVIVAARDIQFLPISRKCHPQKRGVLFQCLRHSPRLQVNDLQPLLAPTAQHHCNFLSTRRHRHPQRHAPQFDRIPHRVKVHSRRQRVGVCRATAQCSC